MKNLQYGQLIKHSVLGVGLVITQKHVFDVYKHKRQYFYIMFNNDELGKVRCFTNESIKNYLLPLQKGDYKMLKLNMSIKQREYLVNILKNAMRSKVAFSDITYNQADYDTAYEQLLKLGLEDDVIDKEDVFVQIMLDNNSITLIETNNPCKHDLTIRKLVVAINTYFQQNDTITSLDELEDVGSDKDNEDILQIAIFDEVYF